MVRTAALLVAALTLAGCLTDEGAPPADVARAVADTRAMDWSPGNWWAYRATVGNVSFDVALIVHERSDDGFHLGTNITAGFFGLPFHGNVSRALNPEVAGAEWPLYRFPLADGKTWDYEIFGYRASTTARAAMIEVPGAGPQPGFRLVATSYGRVFAQYDYVDSVGWFTSLALIEPTKQETLLTAKLTDHGATYGASYHVERVVREVRIGYPAPPGSLEVDIPSGLGRVEARLLVGSGAGVIVAGLRDSAGRPLADAQVLGKGVATDSAGASGRTARTWTLEHKGAGQGEVLLVVTALVPVGEPSPPARADGPGPAYSTRPAVPQLGHVTSTGAPVGV